MSALRRKSVIRVLVDRELRQEMRQCVGKREFSLFEPRSGSIKISRIVVKILPPLFVATGPSHNFRTISITTFHSLNFILISHIGFFLFM